MRRLYWIGLDQIKNIGLNQDDRTKHSRVDESEKSGEDDSPVRQGEAIF